APGRRHDGDPPVRRKARSDTGEMPPEEPREQPPEAPAQPPPQRCVPAILVPAKGVPEVVPGPVQRDRDDPLRGHAHLRRGPEARKTPPPAPPGGGMAHLADPLARRWHRRTRRERRIRSPQHLVPCHDMYSMVEMRNDARKLAFTQYGLLSLEQAEAAGWSRKGLRSSWERFLPGVYRAPEVGPSWRQSAMGLCLWGGAGTAVSHSAAAFLLRLKGFPEGELHAVSTKRDQRLPTWAHVHRVRKLYPGTGRIQAIRVTPPWVTLLDVCHFVGPNDAGRTFDDALLRGLVSLSQMAWALETFGGPGHPGTATLRTLLR